MGGKPVEKWICCGHDIVELCQRAGCSLPERCFFCGRSMFKVELVPQPEDEVAFELAELWSGKVREYHGDPESHAPSFDQYGRPDIEAWRAVGRRVLERSDMGILEPLLNVAEKAKAITETHPWIPEDPEDEESSQSSLKSRLQDLAKAVEALSRRRSGREREHVHT